MQTDKQKQGFAALKIAEDAMKKARKRKELYETKAENK